MPPSSRYPTRFQQKTLWNAATGVSILILGSLLVGLVWLIGQIFGFLQPVLVPIIVAGIIAYVLEPVVTVLENRGMSRFWSVISVFLALLVAITLMVAAVVPGIQRSRDTFARFFPGQSAVTLPTSQDAPADTSPDESPAETQPRGETDDHGTQLGSTLARNLHQLREKYRNNPIGWLLTATDDDGREIPAPSLDESPPTLEFFHKSRAWRMLFEYKGAILTTGREWVLAGSSKIMSILGLVIGLIMVPVYLFFFLKDSAAIRTHWHDYVPLKASRFKTELVGTLQEINGYLVSFFRGQVLVALIDGILVGIALTIFDLPYGFLIGAFMAIIGVIPYIGSILCMIPACIIAFLHAQAVAPFGLGPWAYTGGVVAIFIVVQQINSLVTAPKIVGDSVGLHPMTVIFSMLFWSVVLGGFVGTLLAVPLTAAVKVLFRRFIWVRQMREAPSYPHGELS